MNLLKYNIISLFFFHFFFIFIYLAFPKETTAWGLGRGLLTTDSLTFQPHTKQTHAHNNNNTTLITANNNEEGVNSQ